MTEIFLTSNLYDVVHRTPVSLKELSAIALSIKIWRCEVNKCRSKLKTFNPGSRKICFETELPDLPSDIYNLIEKYVTRFGLSMGNWLQSHYKSVFAYHHNHKNYILKVFDDFVGDYDGNIDYVRTAERMMVCKKLIKVEKFMIACFYCFKDCIKRIWRSTVTGLTNISFEKSPQLFYWVSYLTRKLNRISYRRRRVSELMIDHHMSHNRPSVEYFWCNIQCSERQMRKAFQLFQRDVESFVRFILPKLNDQQLDEFVTRKGCDLIPSLWKNHLCCERFILPAWRYIENKMNVVTLTSLIVEILRFEASAFEENLRKEPENWLYFCLELWNDITPDLRRSIAENILSRSRLFEDMRPANHIRQTDTRFVGFLLIIMSSATFEQRSAFWQKCWSDLISGTGPQDLQQIMDLCFENQNEMADFKFNIMAESREVRRWCVSLLLDVRFDRLIKFVNFCFPKTREARNFKQLVLRECMLVSDRCLSHYFAFEVEKLSLFINDAFVDADQRAMFENELMSTRVVRNYLSWKHINRSSISYEQILKLIKKNLSETMLMKD